MFGIIGHMMDSTSKIPIFKIGILDVSASQKEFVFVLVAFNSKIAKSFCGYPGQSEDLPSSGRITGKPGVGCPRTAVERQVQRTVGAVPSLAAARGDEMIGFPGRTPY
jgi:hypothetical protein